MKLGISAADFENMSNEAKKRHVVNLLINDAGAKPVPDSKAPIAFVMAGIPGAGKTEFLDSLVESLQDNELTGDFIRIDLDQIVTIYPDYTPKTYAKFRSRGNNMIARCIDVMRKRRFNMMIDGTFSGTSGSSLRNIDKLIEAGYLVIMIYMYDDPFTAWQYTQAREQITDRGIDREGFIDSCNNISNNLRLVLNKYRSNPTFSLSLVKQKKLRDYNYDFITDYAKIDRIIDQGYNIDNLKEML